MANNTIRNTEYQRRLRPRVKAQLGVVPTTARNKLMRDLLWQSLPKPVCCFRCTRPMTRDTFSIEHKIPWLDKPNAVELYFDLNNVAYSHQVCNSSASRKNRES